MGLEGFYDLGQVDECIRGNLQVFAKIMLESGGFDSNAATTQFAGEKAEIAVASDENDCVGVEFERKLHRFDAHHDVDVGFVSLLSGGAALLAHDEKAF